jgi:hypothetical protein
MIRFKFGFGFSPILKDEVEVVNEDIDTHLEHIYIYIRFILDFTYFKLETFKKSLKLH